MEHLNDREVDGSFKENDYTSVKMEFQDSNFDDSAKENDWWGHVEQAPWKTEMTRLGSVSLRVSKRGAKRGKCLFSTSSSKNST
jgi:hypothetical protein